MTALPDFTKPVARLRRFLSNETVAEKSCPNLMKCSDSVGDVKNNLSDTRPKLVDMDTILPTTNPLLSALKRPAEKVLGLSRINNGYADAFVQHGSEELANNFFHYICDAFGIEYKVNQSKFAAIPKNGPVIVLSNHPYGLADGLLLGKLLTAVRKDVKLVANEQLEICEEIRSWLISVDPYETKESMRKNLQGIREMMKHLKSGGMLGVFPAGSASSYSRKDKCVIDEQWNANIAALIRKTNATVITVHFPGRNSLLFQGVSLLKKEARVALLPRELKRHVGQKIAMEIGAPIQASSLNKYSSDQGIIDYLKVVTYCQGRKAKLEKATEERVEGNWADIISAVEVDTLVEEVGNLPEDALLVQSGDFSVYVAEADQIPNLLQEIGRLREITFREVGEGSGLACDVDAFDNYYKQLFLWDRKAQRLVGGYRIGEVDKIIAKRGSVGLYNAKFFEFQPEVFDKIEMGLEMGRSFIVKEYQKKPLMLGLIWQGIGHFIAANPQYRYLYGVVSTSAEYSEFSFRLIADFLSEYAMDDELAAYITAKNPLKGGALKLSEIESMMNLEKGEQCLSDLVAQIEDEQKGIPVLLRQYLKLNGKLLGFNIDEGFGGVLDSLILVDLHEAPKRSLQKYMGKEAVAKMFPK